MLVSMIAAVAQNGTIGRNNQLPWRIDDDMRFFIDTTRGHVVISGRKNFDAMGAALPGRTNFVVTRNPAYSAANAHVVTSLQAALHAAQMLGETEVFIIGGAELYHQAKPYAHRFYRTTVLADVVGDIRYDDRDWDGWTRRVIGEGASSATNEYPFRIELLERRNAPQPFDT